MSLTNLIEILVWKDRLNAHKEATVSRFIVSYGDDNFYKVIAKHSCGDHVLINLDVCRLNQIKSKSEAIEYGNTSLKGHVNEILSDVKRSTSDNIRLRRMTLDIENVILAFIEDYGTGETDYKHCYDRQDIDGIALNKDHDDVDRYGDTGSVDTDSELNFSDCSGDTRAEGEAECEHEILELVGLINVLDEVEKKADAINTRGPYVCDQVYECLSNHDREIYSDVVAFRKVKSDPALIEKRKQYWLNSKLFAKLSEIIKKNTY